MRSRKPDTRATMFTWRELSVCATNTAVKGIERGSIVMTLTSGADRGGGGASLPHAPRNAAPKTTSTASAHATKFLQTMTCLARKAERIKKPASAFEAHVVRKDRACPAPVTPTAAKLSHA